MQEIVQRLDRIEKALAEIKTSFAAEIRAKNRSRREAYKLRKVKRDEGKVPLPREHVLRLRDERIQHRAPQWAAAGMRFGRANRPEDFLTWFVYQWNNCCYLKKPLTYSGGYFRVHTGAARHNYGPFDLMGLNNKQKDLMQNDGHLTDFRDRKWWNWAYNILYPVYTAMEELPGFDDLPERFLKGVRLVLGGCGEHEVYTELYWDQNETRANINRMLKRVGLDVRLMWNACCSGLRLKSSPAVP